MNTEQVAKRLVELCREGKGQQAQDELYAADAESVEAPGSQMPGASGVKGMDAIRKKGRDFNESIKELHGGSVGDPIVCGNWFAVTMTMDATFNDPRGRVNMEEICVYHVKNGKIVREQFFYDVG